MKIAICSEGKTVESNISMAVGRAPYFLIFENGALINTIKNPFAMGGGGAGFSVAKMLSNDDINLIVGGRFGNKIIEAMIDRGLKHKILSGMSVKDGLKLILSEN